MPPNLDSGPVFQRGKLSNHRNDRAPTADHGYVFFPCNKICASGENYVAESPPQHDKLANRSLLAYRREDIV